MHRIAHIMLAEIPSESERTPHAFCSSTSNSSDSENRDTNRIRSNVVHSINMHNIKYYASEKTFTHSANGRKNVNESTD